MRRVSSLLLLTLSLALAEPWGSVARRCVRRRGAIPLLERFSIQFEEA